MTTDNITPKAALRAIVQARARMERAEADAEKAREDRDEALRVAIGLRHPATGRRQRGRRAITIEQLEEAAGIARARIYRVIRPEDLDDA